MPQFLGSDFAIATPGSTQPSVNRGAGAGSGNRSSPGAPPVPGGLSSAALAAAVAGRGALPTRGGPGGATPPTAQQALPRPNLAMGAPPMAPPRPGVNPPYPDARSVAATIMPDGQPVMPPPSGFMGPNMIPRVPESMVPHVSPAASSGPPTMPPVHQSHMPLMSNSMQMAHLPPGGAPMPERPGQMPQVMRKPGAPLGPPPAAPAGGPPMGRPAGGIMRPQPGGPPVRAPDGNMYIHAPHATGLYRRVG